jgi:hypothetical protein
MYVCMDGWIDVRLANEWAVERVLFMLAIQDIIHRAPWILSF